MATSHNNNSLMTYISFSNRMRCLKKESKPTLVINSMKTSSLVSRSLDHQMSIDNPFLPQTPGSLVNKVEIMLVNSITKSYEFTISQNHGASPKNIKYTTNPHGLTYNCFSNLNPRRTIPFEDLETAANEAMHAWRTLSVSTEHSMLFETDTPCHWGSDASVQRGQKSVSPESLVTSIIAQPPPWSSNRHDKILMRLFMKTLSSKALVINERKMKLEHVLPNGFSLLDCAIARAKRLDTWATSIEGDVEELLGHFQKWKSLKPALLH